MKNVIQNYLYIKIHEGFPGGSDGKESAAMWDTQVRSESGRSPGEGNGNPLQYSSMENSTDRKSLASNSPWGCIELDMTEQLTHTHTHTHTPLIILAIES